MPKKPLTMLAGWLVLAMIFAFGIRAEEHIRHENHQEPVEGDYELYRAVMCERIKGSTPLHQTVAFSASKGRAFCYSLFDPVRRETHIFHVWYYRDEVVARKKLILKPDRWETYSDQKIGSKVKGPWRVEIADADGNIITDLRFSVTD